QICPAGWTVVNCSCYFLSPTSGSWITARLDCRKRRGDLVIFVRALIQRSAWIGLYEEMQGSWKWVDGTPLSSELKKFWAPGQPDNAGGGEDCAQIWDYNRKWNDDKCGAFRARICEKAPILTLSVGDQQSDEQADAEHSEEQNNAQMETTL
ncbi:hypothetical protein CCH79_00002505, partial [Gambusia affinis]